VFSSSAKRPFFAEIGWHDWEKTAEHCVQQLFSKSSAVLAMVREG
jgi:hypothetical protein